MSSSLVHSTFTLLPVCRASWTASNTKSTSNFRPNAPPALVGITLTVAKSCSRSLRT